MRSLIVFIIVLFLYKATSDCPGTYVDYEGWCYKLITDAKTVPDAAKSCQQEGAWLPASVPGTPGRKIVKSFLDKAPAYIYIGPKYDGHQKCFDYDGKRCLKYSEIEFWAANENEPEEGSLPCVKLSRDDQFKAKLCPCDNEFPVICTKSRDGSCAGVDYFQIMHLCLLISETEGTFENQKTNCMDTQAEPAFVYSKSDWQVVGQTLILKNGPGPFGFLAAAKKEAKGWLDRDGNVIPDDAWLPGHPDPKYGDCAVMVPEMESQELKLQTTACTTETGYLCQTTATPSSGETTTGMTGTRQAGTRQLFFPVIPLVYFVSLNFVCHI